MKLVLFNASDSTGIERAFREIAQQRMEALFVSADGFLLTHSEQIVTLASWTAVPAAYGWRPAVTRGGRAMARTSMIPGGKPEFTPAAS